VLSDRTVDAIAHARAAGIPTIVATGRMFRSVRPYLAQAGIDDPVVCYQGAVVADPRSGTFLAHLPIELEVAREAVAFLSDRGHPPNVYVGDELFVAAHTEHSRRYAGFQHLRVTEVGDLTEWLAEAPTKLVVVAEPQELQVLREAAVAHFGGALFVTTSLPTFLEFGRAGVSKGSGIVEVCGLLGLDIDRIVAFGDGENDVELLEAAGFGFAIEAGHPRLLEVADATCAPPDEHGVAGVIEAYLAGPGPASKLAL
jgi:Cof subfamily protein (haloacid dehalogenase superfamily)